MTRVIGLNPPAYTFALVYQQCKLLHNAEIFASQANQVVLLHLG